MKKLLSIIILIVSHLSFGQISAIVLDNDTKEAVPYVNIWVENENTGTTTDENGKFTIDNSKGKTLILSSLGYETKNIGLSNIPKKIFLIPKAFELDEIIISSKKAKTQKIIGEYNDDDIGFYYASNNKPEIKARLFPYQPSYSETPFLSKIKFNIFSDVKNAKFNIRFYSVDERGEPGNPIYENNIIGTAKKGVHNITLDLSNVNITFPENGFFISYEWLIIDDNKLKYSLPNDETGFLYEPKIGLLPVTDNQSSWTFRNGNWKKVEKFSGNTPKPYFGNYGTLAIELTLTD